ncbi:hypothetical protein R3I93_019837 [Phoxinus phoxinus]|uniref:Uncharacterized protein n=1 Tax=Phoxinus phoxinus TaxID=58324 RepID=A0AAN9GWT5_9TELE
MAVERVVRIIRNQGAVLHSMFQCTVQLT